MEDLQHGHAEGVAARRRHYQDLERAMADYGCPVGSRPIIRDIIADLEFDEIWTVQSGSYIALGRGGRAVAWIGKTYVDFKDGAFVQLPGFVDKNRTTQAGEPRYGLLCPSCQQQMPLTGICDTCD